jgi:hypothetical protein
MKYSTQLPENFKSLEKKHQNWYLKKQHYTLGKIKQKKLKNVFITTSGVIIHKYKIPFKSAENLFGTYDYTFYFKHWRKAFEQFLVSKYGSSLNSINLQSDNQLYFSIQTPWFGYFSWMTTYLPRLLKIHTSHPNATLLVPDEWKSIPYVSQTLTLFPNLRTEFVPANHHVFVKNYLLQQIRPWTSKFYPEEIQMTQNIILQNIEIATPKKRIYISRRLSKRRKIVNEAELEMLLSEYGFTSVFFENLSIDEQAKIMHESEIVLSLHGAGLTNCMFMQQETSLIEIIPKVDQLKDFRFPFWRISSLCKLKYYSLFSETVDNNETDIYDRDTIVDIQNLISIFDKITLNKA